MKNQHVLWLLLIAGISAFSCQSPQKAEGIPVVGFVEAFEDATIAQAREGFEAALSDSGYSETDGTIRIIHRNAQGDAATLNQIISYFNSQGVDLIGTSTTLATIAAVQRSKDIPIFQTVTAMPEILGLLESNGQPPAHLFGTGEDLNYIDTSFAIITEMVKPKEERLTVGMIYNQSEPQSVEAYERIASLAESMDVQLEALPLNSSAEAQLVVRSLLTNNIDAFFANPDNTVFAAFETILKNCNDKGIPVFTSESGLVSRGAVAAFGADIYRWGYQSGAQAATYLKTQSTDSLKVEMLQVRKRVYNPDAAKRFGFSFSETFEAL
ncbi:ABC transporter substrate-binding protein [Parapedobacter koreensis]|uniref:Putative ABC transport system substrate-binding protein n=1 Tax=Parapedobacter koreensis TaxID=332977 RepID=A0A1H7TGJ2_9SPHI|nr:ABC transporter substrate-binding protein [Parapedobacter koreensis]SEL83609.1 putative ABC transport system substrate-binding protein [Parapedobacter koreensis]